jgi:DNA-binding response OmpR family regulator
MTTNKGKKVLIVDDDTFLLDMYSVKFKEEGYTVIPALGSVDALEKLEEGERPDAMLLDVVMPAMDGFELLTKVKEENLAEGAKILFLSNLGQQSDIDKGTELGADGYIVKASATPSEVVEHVNALLA